MPQASLLLVDDEPSVLNALIRVARRVGCPVRAAKSPEEGLDILDGVGVVVTDYMMPGMDGLEFLRRVRERRPHTTRYMLTGSVGSWGVTEAVADGTVSAVFAKPWDDGMLQFAIRRGFELYCERAT